jgi:hypothetical protein
VRRTWELGRIALAGIALVAVAGGCTDSGTPTATASFVAPVAASSAPAWTEPASYHFVLTRGCDAAKPLGRYRVAVRNGAVATTQRLDRAEAEPSSSAAVDLGPATGQDGEEIEVPTLRGLLDLVQTAADDGGEVTETFDATDGHPVKVSFNVSDNASAGDAECFTVSEYAVAP